MRTDPSGRYACLYKRWHLIGLEVGISVASVGLRGEPTGCATGFRADVVATAKRDLKAGEMLDGEGGYTVYGKLFPAAIRSRSAACRWGLRTTSSCSIRSRPARRYAGATSRRRVGHGGVVPARDGARFRAGAGSRRVVPSTAKTRNTEPANAAGSRRPRIRRRAPGFRLGCPFPLRRCHLGARRRHDLVRGAVRIFRAVDDRRGAARPGTNRIHGAALRPSSAAPWIRRRWHWLPLCWWCHRRSSSGRPWTRRPSRW